MYKSCTNLIQQMNDLMCSERDYEDVDTQMEDHAYDALRYAISSVRDRSGFMHSTSSSGWKSDLFYFFGRR